MNAGFVSGYFKGVAFKRLSAVEADPQRSNQHELNGVASLRQLLGQERREAWAARFLYFNDDEDVVAADGSLSWYDSRERQTHRSSEFRLYFTTNSVMDLAAEGDLCVVARTADDSPLVVIGQRDSTAERQLALLFELGEYEGSFRVKDFENGSDVALGIVGRQLLDVLGIEVEERDDSQLARILKEFGESFPSSKLFSRFARSLVRGISPMDEPDECLIAYMEREELIFRALERHLVAERIEAGFQDVDDFIAFSLSVQNRRKARAGLALENHLEQIFAETGIYFDRGKQTELKSTPDFIFPGIRQYHDDSYSADRLTMLAVKSTCKERWRQILAEARKIEEKHLLTLEPAISQFQTDEMKSNKVQLVVPEALHATFRQSQKEWLFSVKNFVDLVRARQQ